MIGERDYLLEINQGRNTDLTDSGFEGKIIFHPKLRRHFFLLKLDSLKILIELFEN